MGLFATFLHLAWYEQVALIMVIVAAIISLIYALWLRRDVLKYDKGTKKMQEVWTAIKNGAKAYLSKQLRTILPIIALLTFILFLSVYIVPPSLEALEVFPPSEGYSYQQVQLIIATGRAIAFIMGALSSLAVGQLGMRIAIESNIRVASASGRSYREALKIAYHGGTFTGMLTDGLGLLGGTFIFLAFGISAPDALLGFGFGGTLLALFMRIGGGIYTKAADVGADLVGKVEAGLPEDDPRNAAVIADLVGDNVGDCAGMAADIFESYEVTIVSALILGVALYVITGQIFWIVFPLVVRAIGVISSIIGTFMVAVWRTEKAEKAMFYSYEVSSAFTIIVSSVFAYFYTGDVRLGILVAIGVLLAVSFNPLTNYFTSHRHRPVEEIVEQAHGGPATIVLSGISTGYEAAVWILLIIVATFIAAFLIAPEYVLYGIALIGIGMLSHTGNNVAMDSYGPIADNAGGIAELTDMPERSRKVLADLDAVGNTTKAITKNVAIASAVIAASALFYSFVVDVARAAVAAGIPNPLALGIRIDNPLVLSGLLIGAALPWLFSALAIRAVSRASTQIIDEVREQFKIPGVMEGTVKPHYDRVVSITTAAAQKELISLTILSVVTPIVIGLMLQVEALGGYLAGLIASGLLLAVYMSVAGGAWDNAKKYIEDEVCDLEVGTGKGSERHKAAVCGDTIGDPLKDTAGPALNPMIKVVNLISLIAAPILILYRFYNPGWPPDLNILMWNLMLAVVVIILLVLLIWAFRRSRRSIPPLAEWESRD
ncbi:MAG: sodium-translocating pyrophosphatase [Candidatus Odinarchaeota archaeon]